MKKESVWREKRTRGENYAKGREGEYEKEIPRSLQVPFIKGAGSRNQPESWNTRTFAFGF